MQVERSRLADRIWWLRAMLLEMLLAFFLIVSPTAEASMSLQLTLSTERTEILFGESIALRVVLTNTGSSAVHVPRLALNTEVLAIEVFGAEHQPLGRYTWSDARYRLGEEVVSPKEMEWIDLAPTASDEIVRQLFHMVDPLPPGRYFLRAHHQKGEIDVLSNEIELGISPSQPQHLCWGFDRDIGGPYHLLFAYVDRQGNKGVLLEGSTFAADGSLMSSISRRDVAIDPKSLGSLKIARALGEDSDRASTLLWTEKGRLRWMGVGPASAEEGTLDLAGVTPSILDHPYRTAETTWVLLSSASGGDGQLLRIDPGQPAQIAAAGLPAGLVQLVVGDLGEPLLIVRTKDARETVLSWRKPVGAGATGTLLKTAANILAVDAVTDERGLPFVAVALHEPESRTLHVNLYEGEEPASTGSDFALELPEEADLSTLQLVAGADDMAQLLVRTNAGTWFCSVEGEPLRALEDLPPSFERSGEGSGELQLLVGRDGRGFLLGPGAHGGLLLHRILLAPSWEDED